MSQKPRASTPAASSPDPVSRAEGVRAKQPVPSADKVSGVAQVAQATQAAAVGKVRGAEPVRKAAAVGRAAPVEATPRSELVKEIAGKLRRGEITASQAVEDLIDDAVRCHLDGFSSDDPFGEELRATLHSYMAHDPLLSARVRKLSKTR